MSIESRTRKVFGAFHNLNLLVLREDLRSERVSRAAWLSGGSLCPVAHGLPSGRHLREVIALAVADFTYGCDYAAALIGADPASVWSFVNRWDTDLSAAQFLLQQFEELWQERLADADAMQNVLEGGKLCVDR
jgi:hypothetical protein